MEQSEQHKTPSSCCAPPREVRAPVPDLPAALLAAENAPAATVEIPGGTALLGTQHPLLPVDGEAPLRKKRVRPFRMDATTVTNARFAAFVQATGYKTTAERIGDSFVFVHLLPEDAPPSRAVAEAPWWRVIPGACWHAPVGPASSPPPPDHPVVHVSWQDAQVFAKWAGGRLPTEAEWEHAARGGLGDVPYPWGAAEPNDTDHFPCNIWQGRFPDVNTGADGHLGTAPAQSFQPNAYGLYNMVGNVWEWTSELFKVRSLKKAVAAANAGKAGYKLQKGGSFLCHSSYCYRYRIAARTGNSADSSTSHQGLRLVYDM
jgi:formylglycine-generating enzyme required for sulfatase activity